MNREAFSKLNTSKRFALVRDQGEFVGQRIHGSHNIQLFALHGYYVEVWKKIGLDYLHWVEVVTDDKILLQYTSGIDLDLNKLLGDSD